MKRFLLSFYFWLTEDREYEHWYNDPGAKVLGVLIVVLFLVVLQAAIKGANTP